MGLFKKIFRKGFKKENPVSPEALKISEIQSKMDFLLNENRYIAKSEYLDFLKNEKETIQFFSVLKSSETLKSYCKNNHLVYDEIVAALTTFDNFENIVDKHNDDFIESSLITQKKYLDNILKDVDPKILLDDDQRKVVLTDEDYSLVIAGAGAGKTTTVAAKVKYLVEKKNINPKQILVVSFTNKAVQELQEKINGDLKIDCPICTFHSAGNAILRKQSPEKLNIVDSSKLYFVILDYLKNSVLKNESLVNNLILFFSSYFDASYEGNDLNTFFNKIAKGNYSTLKSDLDKYKTEIIDSRSKKTVTIQSEVMRSYQEVEIANFLYLNNIEYDYEPLYKYDILYARKPYTPDFLLKQGNNLVYLEHFGISETGENNRYSDDELTQYKKAVHDKIRLHKAHNTKLIYTFSKYKDNRPLTEHLKEELEKAGFILVPRSNKEIMEELVSSEENRYIRKLVNLICRFISNFKTNGFTNDDFNRMYHSTQNVRSQLFLNICNDCYLEYERYLNENHAVDFEDMINNSAKILREQKELKKKLDFKYIIVDEYQDISRQRFDLVTALSDVTDAKIIAVGDDWQSIYAFSGSDITLFTKFAEKMGYAKLLKIVKTYRNSQEVIDIAGNFIQKNASQIQKTLQSPKNIEDPVIIYTYDSNYKKPGQNRFAGINYATARAVEIALEQIIEYNRKENKDENSSVLLLGRFGFDGDKLEKSGLFEYVERGQRLKSVKYPKLNITFMTAHASKGLGYDNVVIINGKNEIYGFPSKIEDDPVLSFVIKGDNSIDYAEERRLFYVAMTRTKNRVFIIAPEKNPSEFLLEIKHDYKNVSLKGKWNDEAPKNNIGKKTCPICGYPLQYRYKNAYGLRLYICTNEPEVCGFMTNEYKAEKLSIMKCDKCRDGYLIIKPGKNNQYFLGCTNYNRNGTGCNNVMSSAEYYEKFGYELNSDSTNNTAPLLKESPSKNQHNTNKVNKDVDKCLETKYDIAPKNIPCEDIIHNGISLSHIVNIILNALTNVSKQNFYGKTMLIDVLRGSKSKKIFDKDMYKIPEYGVLSTVDRDSLTLIVEFLIDEKFILQTKNKKYPVLHPTYNSLHYADTIKKSTLIRLKKLLEA